ncbi:hypothetical protein BUALT_Bualt06G0050800 [Buddleja alternifolia]|uniref:Uncharacterized protein n=1 Tax=Buddleja alternifolia TaxID=168488 RepID=A0AAV6XJL2_9LAMI|nr:hypothetical protein BUALT_Bualt06G0050800 [Buddleja alternifolia]
MNDPLHHDRFIQFVLDVQCKEHGNGHSRASKVPVYLRLVTGFINNLCQLMDAEGIKKKLRSLESLHGCKKNKMAVNAPTGRSTHVCWL